MDASHHDHAGKVGCGLVKTREDPSRLLQPANEAFDNVASTIEVAIELRVALIIRSIRLLGNHGLNILTVQPLDDTGGAIGLVACQGHGLHIVFELRITDERTVNQLLEDRAFVRLPCRELKVQRMALAIADEVDLCRKTPTRTA